MGHSLASLIAAARGRSRKVLVLDLDNTLWGGVIGDDGPDKHRDRPRDAARRGLHRVPGVRAPAARIAASCSRSARRTTTRCAARLRASGQRAAASSDFAAFVANWEPEAPEHRGDRAAAEPRPRQLRLRRRQPAERQLVDGQLPMVAVPTSATTCGGIPASSTRPATSRPFRSRPRTRSATAALRAECRA